MKIRKLLLLVLIAVCLFFSLQTLAAETPKIRVGLYYGGSAVDGKLSLSFENGFQAGYVADDGMFMPFGFFPYNSAVVTANGDSIKISDSDGELLYEGYGGISVGICPISSELDNGISYTKIGSIKYPETLQFSAKNGKITVINIVDGELYFKGVLPSEVYPSWHEEALKAAAIATRTYTYHSMNRKHAAYGFDVCTTTCCQVYSGITKCQPSTNNAVDSTKNLVLTYNGRLITAVYHAISGGITESAAGAWGSSPDGYPYLTVVETPFEIYDEIAMGSWKKVLYDESFNSLIASSSHFGKITAPIQSITVDDSTPGYLNNMTITDNRGNSIFLKTSSDIRSFFSFPSSNFTIQKAYIPWAYEKDSATVLTASGECEFVAGNYAAILTSSGKETVGGIRSAYLVDGKGYGHGVGLSQYGAQYAAKAGYTYDQILSIYFPGTTLENYASFTNN